MHSGTFVYITRLVCAGAQVLFFVKIPLLAVSRCLWPVGNGFVFPGKSVGLFQLPNPSCLS